ncbi:MAG: hypothetical protein NVSMB9_34170 [Isosphaeraceae bacterium]
MGDWLQGLAGGVCDALEALGPGRRGRRLLDEFADLIETTGERELIEAALVRLAGALSGACRVELFVDRDEGAHLDQRRRIAVWPDALPELTSKEAETLGYPLSLGLRCGDHYQMTLQLYAKPGRGGRWPRPVLRRLYTLRAMAAAAERGLHSGRRAPGEPEGGASEAAVRDATFLNAILPYALAQAKRHREPLSVFCVGMDRLLALAVAQGKAVADLAVRRLAEEVARTLRGSDVVARLDDDRIIVVLPNTGPSDAWKVARVLRSALDAASLALGSDTGRSVSIGLACFPEDGAEMVGLIAAADEAMIVARARGPNGVASFARIQ